MQIMDVDHALIVKGKRRLSDTILLAKRRTWKPRSGNSGEGGAVGAARLVSTTSCCLVSPLGPVPGLSRLRVPIPLSAAGRKLAAAHAGLGACFALRSRAAAPPLA